jgi:hypothetical protein
MLVFRIIRLIMESPDSENSLLPARGSQDPVALPFGFKLDNVDSALNAR